LVRAAENGKDVTVLMELRARFDEQNNIVAAERLEEAGCNVIYGFEDYKVHSKICLITYKNRRSISTITQIGTGNYNEKTSHLYTDYSYITSRSDIGRDAIAFFQNMAISNLQGSYERILTSPMQLKQTILDQLDEQIARVKQGQSGYAFFKLNSLTDLEIIKKLSEASQAGVQIEMVIRGICCLLPGLEGYTENIKIYSIVGRFLEHSRIYIFGQDKQRKMYISSADFMTRNTERRVEVAVPILDAQIQEDILDFVGAILKDNTKRRQLLSSGLYGHVQESDEENFGVQDYEIKKAEQDQYVPDGKSFSLFEKLRTQLDIRKNAHR
jgi:polyphosphate kinase